MAIKSPFTPPVLETFQLPIRSQLLPKHFARYSFVTAGQK
jgi:hypothetical protein